MFVNSSTHKEYFMRHIISVLLLSLSLLSLNASAILISETFVVEKQLSKGSTTGHIFELINAGYSPATDSITNIKLTYDFTEIWSLANQGDEDQYNDEDYPEFDENRPQYEDEFVTFSSWIFNWRDWEPDVDSGLTVFETDWTRNDYCQFEAFDWQDETKPSWCALNIDLAGTANAHVTVETNNLWLHSIKLEVEVDRKETEVVEPNSLLLLGLGLIAIGLLRSRKENRLRHATT
jgi:hypothetical protein